MSEHLLVDFPCEPERYELYEEAALSWEMSRREFFRILPVQRGHAPVRESRAVATARQ